MAQGENWFDKQNDLIVADYFEMLAEELADRRFNKAAHNRALQQRIGRSGSSIEFKHRNISAVLQSLGETWINGYKPAYNFQMSLAEAVARHLLHHPLPSVFGSTRAISVGLAEPPALRIEEAPTRRNEPPPEHLEKALAVAAKFDVAARDEQNRQLGRAGEELVLARERSELVAQNRRDLAEQIRWVSEEDGDGAGYDIASFYPDGRDRLIEVKTTNGWERTPFFISRNELAVADTCRDTWSVFRVWNFRREPRAFELFPPLEAHVQLTPTTFQASFH